jgi:hypothetical protein
MTDRRRDSRQVFQPADGGRKVQSGGDFDQLQDVPLFPALMTSEAFVPDCQVRRLSPLRLTDWTEKAAASTLKTQGDSDPLRISSSLQRVKMFMVSHYLFLKQRHN